MKRNKKKTLSLLADWELSAHLTIPPHVHMYHIALCRQANTVSLTLWVCVCLRSSIYHLKSWAAALQAFDVEFMHAVKWNRAVDRCERCRISWCVYLFCGCRKNWNIFRMCTYSKLRANWSDFRNTLRSFPSHSQINANDYVEIARNSKSDSALNGKWYFQECLQHKNITRTGDDDAFHYPIKFCAVFFDDLIKRIG